MKIAICDDDGMDLLYLQTLISEYDSTLDTTLFHTAKDLLTAFQTTFFDVVFMDIEMEHPNGYEAAEILMQQEDKPLIIFVTNSGEYTIRGYGIAFRYMPKPLSQSAVFNVLSLALEAVSPQKVEVNLLTKKVYISAREIYYAEASGHIVMLYTKAGNFQCRCKLKDIESQLPMGRFARPHNSFVINLDEVESSARASLILTNGTTIPISQRYSKAFNIALVQYIRRC